MRKQLYGDNADERLVRRSWEGGEAGSLVRRVAAASLPVELLAGPATLIGALCPHKVAHYHTTTLPHSAGLSHFHSGSHYQTITKPHLPRPHIRMEGGNLASEHLEQYHPAQKIDPTIFEFILM